MKWFKHYTNAHKGTILQHLTAHFSVNEAYALYFRFIEYLSDKWDGSSAPNFTVNEVELKKYLTVTQRKLDCFLTTLQLQSDFKFKRVEPLLNFEFPKLLEIRHRDALNAGTRQALIQHESGVEKSKRKNKNIHTVQDWQQKAFDLLAEKYREYFPGTDLGRGALKRFCAHAETPEAAAEVVGSVTNYRNYLKSLTWDRQPKTSIATYLGTKDEPFWTGYRTAVAPIAAQAAGSMRGA